MQEIIKLGVNYRKLDMWIEITEYEISDEDTANPIEFTVEYDYKISESTPHPLDEFAMMVHSMMADGDHLQEKIMDYVLQDDEEHEKIYIAISEELEQERIDDCWEW